MPSATQPTPVEISRAGESDVQIRWSDGKVSVFPARLLRLACPCAHCVDETTGRRVLRESTVPPDVRPLAIVPVGRYAIEIQWSDGHRTGIYTWELLYRLAGQLP